VRSLLILPVLFLMIGVSTRHPSTMLPSSLISAGVHPSQAPPSLFQSLPFPGASRHGHPTTDLVLSILLVADACRVLWVRFFCGQSFFLPNCRYAMIGGERDQPRGFCPPLSTILLLVALPHLLRSILLHFKHSSLPLSGTFLPLFGRYSGPPFST